MQITAEQILREAKELQEQDFKPPSRKITDQVELNEYRLRKRKEYEDLVRRVRWNQSIWVKVESLLTPWGFGPDFAFLTLVHRQGRVRGRVPPHSLGILE